MEIISQRPRTTTVLLQMGPPFEMLLDDADALQCVLRALNTVGCRDAAVAKVALMSTCKHFQPGRWLANIMLFFGIRADGLFTMDPDSLLATVAYHSQEVEAVRTNRVVAGIKLFHRPLVLNFAAGCGLDLCARALLEAGSDLNLVTKKGNTALILAAHHGHDRCARALLEAGSDPNKANLAGGTALMFASNHGHDLCVRALLEAGSDPHMVNNAGGTALISAAQGGYDLCTRALLEAGSDPNKANLAGWTALMLAALNGHEQVGGALLDAGSDPNMTRLPNGEAALHLACHNGHLKCTQRLIGAGANVELVGDDGCTSLMTAAANGHEECVDAVLKDAVLNPRSTRCSPRLCALRKILLVDMNGLKKLNGEELVERCYL